MINIYKKEFFFFSKRIYLFCHEYYEIYLEGVNTAVTADFDYQQQDVCQTLLMMAVGAHPVYLKKHRRGAFTYFI